MKLPIGYIELTGTDHSSGPLIVNLASIAVVSKTCANESLLALTNGAPLLVKERQEQVLNLIDKAQRREHEFHRPPQFRGPL